MIGKWTSFLLSAWLLIASAQGQTTAARQRAAQFYAQAAELHQSRKHTEALAKLKAALALVPRSKIYLAYQKELETLASQDARDAPAVQTSGDTEASIERLAAHLGKSAKDDREKARLIYRWITEHIAYDVEGVLADGASMEDVLRKRVASCESYADLFEQLGKQMGLEVAKVHGWAKGYGYVAGSKLEDRNSTHTWNAVKLDGQWRLVDCTWGSGVIVDRKFVKQYRDHFFLPSPEQFLFTHFPADSQWQLVTPPISKEEFLQWPKVDLPLFRMGWKVADVGNQMKKSPTTGIVQAGDPVPMRLTFRAAPLEGKLRAGMRYQFQAEAAGIAEMAVLDSDGRTVRFKQKDTTFEGTTVARKGKLYVGVRPPHGKPQFFHFVLEYVVE